MSEDFELVKPDFFDGKLLASLSDTHSLFADDECPPPTGLYRLTRTDAPRIYFARDPVRVFPSVTSVIKETTPTSNFLIKWIGQMGLRQAEQYRDARAAFGTLMHNAFGKFMINGAWDLATTQDFVDAYAKEEMLTCDTGTWSDELKSAVTGFAEFLNNYAVRPIGIELPFASDKLGWAGSIDLVALANLGPKKKNVLCLIDFKSGDFHSEAEVQTGAYRMLFDEAYPHTPIQAVLLYGPKAFDEASRTHYRLKDVTRSPLKDLMPNLLEQFKVRNPDRPLVLELDGTLKLREDPEQVIKFSKIEDIVERLGAA